MTNLRTFSVTTHFEKKISLTLEKTANGNYFLHSANNISYFVIRNNDNPARKWDLFRLDHKKCTRELLASAHTIQQLIFVIYCNINYTDVHASMDFVPNVYKPLHAYEFDTEKRVILGRFRFIIRGELSDGTKCWYKCDENNEIIGTAWYSMTRKNGRLLAIMEAID